MSGLNGDYRSLAEAVGEAPWQRAGYEPSHSWTGSELAEMHEDDLEAVRLVTARDRHRADARRIAGLERENARLRRLLDDEFDPDDGDPDEGGEDAHLDAAYEDRWDDGREF